jgi:predicted AAA+ superfamily ATPase
MMQREFDRDIYSLMQKWKDNCVTAKVAFVLDGARQVGKTHCVKKFANENFAKVYYADFMDQGFREKAEFVLGKFFDTKQIVETLFMNFQDSKDAIIVLDEIQEFSHIYNLIRPINRTMDSHLMVTGSFLGRVLDKGFFTPAGDTTVARMYGLSFPEFLDALDMRELYIDANLFGGSEPIVYERLRKAFSLYCRVGGYPKVVEEFLATQKFDLVDDVLRVLVYSITEETGRYFKEIQDSAKLNRLLNGVASLLVRDKRGLLRFASELGRIVEGTDKRSVVNALHWFWKSGILEPCGRVNDCDPNRISPESLFYFSDLGVASYLYRQLSVQETNIYGVACENFAYSCIRDMGGVIPKEPSFATYGSGELDYLFFVKSSGKIMPVGVEVKGGKAVGNTAMKLLKDEKISYLVNAKVETLGGRHENIFTVPLPLLGKFNIFDYIPSDDVLEQEKLKNAFDSLMEQS